MLSKSRIKYIHSLNVKKVRKEEGVFLAEGPKLVEELLQCFSCRFLAATAEWLKKNSTVCADEVVEVSEDELHKASLLKTPQQVLAIFTQPEHSFKQETIKHSLCLALDDVQDPGNLGTIIRIADWFGIEDIICSPNTADVYNPKTIQATMGAIARVRVHYTPLVSLLQNIQGLPIYGTLLDGENIYDQTLEASGLIIMGNEGNGISAEVQQYVNHKLLIPNYPSDRNSSESLNVAIATAVVCAEFRRRK